MSRTTADLVEGIIEVDDTIPLDPFISVANELVTEYCLTAGYSDTRLELIERWLSAHFYSVRDRRVTSEGAGGVSESMESKDRLDYYEQARLLDTKHKLPPIKPTAGGKGQLAWLGRPECDP